MLEVFKNDKDFLYLAFLIAFCQNGLLFQMLFK